MPDMTPEAATALRKPFPPESIGKLPKPLKRDDSAKGKCAPGSPFSADGHFCGGWHSRSLHLDFAGHAAVTDRLLAVDPMWSWEPLALDSNGLPCFDQRGNLWIRLTICGVTRLGVGDGSSLKEVIGDAIRNAAMRFGVGLDLWAKENLVEFAQHAQQAAATPPAAEPRITETQSKRLHALLRECGIDDRDKKLALAKWSTGREIASTSELTVREASALIDYLVNRAADMAAAAKEKP